MKRAARERRPGLVRQRLRRGAYVLPSLFTTGNIMLGFFAIVRGYKGHFDDAALLIFGREQPVALRVGNDGAVRVLAP